MFLILTLCIDNIKSIYNKKSTIVVTSEYSINVWSKILKNNLKAIIVDDKFNWNIEEINNDQIVFLSKFKKMINQTNNTSNNTSKTNNKEKGSKVNLPKQNFIPQMKVEKKHQNINQEISKSTNNQKNNTKNYSISQNIDDNKFNIKRNIDDKIIMPKNTFLKFNNKTIVITSEKGGVGKTTCILELINKVNNSLFIDLNFQDGGSDLSFNLSLPQNPNITKFLLESNFKESIITTTNNNLVLQAPMYSHSVKYLDKYFITNIKNAFQGNIFIDMPHLLIHENYYDVLQDSDVILIISNGTKNEISRIITKYKNLLNKVIILLTNNNTDILFNLNIKYCVLNKDFISTLNSLRLG